MTPEPKHNIYGENENSVDIQIGENLFNSAIEVLQNTVELQELLKSYPESNIYMRPVEFTQDGWEYQISVSKIKKGYVNDRIISIRRQKELEVEEINIKKNYEDSDNNYPIRVNCSYEYYKFYEPTQKINVKGPISVDFIRDFIDDLCF